MGVAKTAHGLSHSSQGKSSSCLRCARHKPHTAAARTAALSIASLNTPKLYATGCCSELKGLLKRLLDSRGPEVMYSKMPWRRCWTGAQVHRLSHTSSPMHFRTRRRCWWWIRKVAAEFQRQSPLTGRLQSMCSAVETFLWPFAMEEAYVRTLGRSCAHLRCKRLSLL